ncbi:MAG TPA: EthD family reductase [Rhodopila sp.]|uniref:EthD family reductase n=1 Tax=Rhodopila sp. TaxID=2480087 RepID=UPI002B933DF0|nr:EthD family reductase [Rhodopila sp.]HVY15745.1 EthD family reductase [Rhodopila sp.]
MIAAISLMRRQDGAELGRFRRHWLDVHGPLVCAFPRLRRYVQCHVVESSATNDAARAMRIDGFPILFFDDDADRMAAHRSPEMAACNIDSRLFVGAVSRVIADAVGELRTGPGRFSLIEIWPPGTGEGAGRPVRYGVREQGRAPNSVIPHLAVEVGHMAQTWFDSLVDLETRAAPGDPSVARFVVEEHWLA